MTNLALSGGEETNEKLKELNDELAMWEGIDLKKGRNKAAWEFLEIKGKG